jgi:hypothetical protein
MGGATEIIDDGARPAQSMRFSVIGACAAQLRIESAIDRFVL